MKVFSGVLALCLALGICAVCGAEDMNATEDLVSPETGNMPAQEAVSASANADMATVDAASISDPEVETVSETSEPAEETKWIWAEVVSIDPDNNQFTAKYLSYDSDEEKEIVLATDSNTNFENFKALSEMTAGDNVSVDYLSDPSGTSLARSVSLQKAKPDSEIEAVSGEESSTPEAAMTEEDAVNAEIETPEAVEAVDIETPEPTVEDSGSAAE